MAAPKDFHANQSDISHIKLGASKEPIILDIDDCTDTRDRCQTLYRAY